MLSHDDIELFTGRERRIFAGEGENYPSQLFSVQNKVGRKQRRKSGGVREWWKRRDTKTEYRLRNWCKKKEEMRKNERGTEQS